jgi:hypothetical protein
MPSTAKVFLPYLQSSGSDETDEFNAGLTTIGELTKTVSDGTQTSDIVARRKNSSKHPPMFPKMLLKTPRATPLNGRNKNRDARGFKSTACPCKKP